jgi:small subunit ribosomal protein S16
MAVKIRLQRHGRKKLPYYIIVAANVTAPRDGAFLEEIGIYNPLLPKEHKDRIKIDGERYSYWLKSGAQPTETVVRLYNTLNNIPQPVKTSPKKSIKKS